MVAENILIMKAKELRIGNLIFEPYSDTIVVVDIDILNVISKKLPNIDNYRPIQLTEEWLVKFGFEYDDKDDWYVFDSDLGISISHIIDGLTHYFCSLECVWADILTEIKYVHQLQNLYFALTGQELTYTTN